MARHWAIRYDPDDGEPFGYVCDCELNEDHNGNGELMEEAAR